MVSTSFRCSCRRNSLSSVTFIEWRWAALTISPQSSKRCLLSVATIHSRSISEACHSKSLAVLAHLSQDSIHQIELTSQPGGARVRREREKALHLDPTNSLPISPQHRCRLQHCLQLFHATQAVQRNTDCQIADLLCHIMLPASSKLESQG